MRHVVRLAVGLGALAATVAADGSVGAGTTQAQGKYTNPIVSGDCSDPVLIRVGEVFYSVRSSFGWQPGLPIVRHLRDGKRGDPDLGWVGRYKEPKLTSEEINGLPENQRQAQRGGNVWTAHPSASSTCRIEPPPVRRPTSTTST